MSIRVLWAVPVNLVTNKVAVTSSDFTGIATVLEEYLWTTGLVKNSLGSLKIEKTMLQYVTSEIYFRY